MILSPIAMTIMMITDKLNIVINSEFEGTAYISLTNQAGKKISDFKRPVIAGENIVIINENNLAPSVYYLKIIFPGTSRTIPVLKTKQ
jgi:hypothetical protein